MLGIEESSAAAMGKSRRGRWRVGRELAPFDGPSEQRLDDRGGRGGGLRPRNEGEAQDDRDHACHRVHAMTAKTWQVVPATTKRCHMKWP